MSHEQLERTDWPLWNTCEVVGRNQQFTIKHPSKFTVRRMSI